MRKKVFLPKWQKYYIGPLMLIIWGVGTYQEFFTGQREMGNIGYAFFTLVLLGVGGMVWLMASGKLPAYEIEESEQTDDRNNEK